MTEKRNRRWFQFSLRALLVFALLVSIAMSWLGTKIARARKQRMAVAAIQRAGGMVDYEPLEDPSIPQWLRGLLGDDFFISVYAVVVDKADFGDDEAASLKALDDLQYLMLVDTQVTDAGLEHIEGLTSLEWLLG